MSREMAYPESLKYPEWQEPLLDALAETDPRKARLKLGRAEIAIKKRLLELSRSLDHHEEMQAIEDGLRMLQVLFPDTKQKKNSA